MLRARWRDRVRPTGIVVLAAVMTSLAALPLAGSIVAPAAAAPACPAGAGQAVAAAAKARRAPAAQIHAAQRMNGRGQYLGRSLRVAAARGATVELSLPVESAVAEPVGNVLVYSHSTGGRSEVHAIDLESGCDQTLARPAGVVRSAQLAADGSAVYVHSVSAAGRADLGVSRYALDGGTVELVVPPLPADDRYGPTFGTQLSLSPDGSALAVQSCGFGACRTRVLDIASGGVETYDEQPHGALIGVVQDGLIAFDACRGMPCPVIAVDRSGVTTTLAIEAWSATLGARADGSAYVSIETAAGFEEFAP